MSVFTFLQWLWLILLVGGVPLLLLRPLRLKAGKPLTDRAKSWLWFLQALGFWAIVIGGWMKLEAVIPELLEPEEEEATEGDEPADDEARDDEGDDKKKREKDDEDEGDEEDDD
jgi:flagellar biosynthesis/type III secretory pathway M-ring protein FliF/YscJ